MKIRYVLAIILVTLTIGVLSGCELQFVTFNGANSSTEETVGEEVADAEAWAAAFADCQENWSMLVTGEITTKEGIEKHSTEMKKDGNKAFTNGEGEEVYLFEKNGGIYIYKNNKWKFSKEGTLDDSFGEVIGGFNEVGLASPSQFENFTYNKEKGVYIYSDKNDLMTKSEEGGYEMTIEITIKEGKVCSVIAQQYTIDGGMEGHITYKITFGNTEIEIPEFDLEKIESFSSESSVRA